MTEQVAAPKRGGERSRGETTRDFTEPVGISITHNTDSMEKYL